MTATYRWTFYRSGGVDQVALQSRDDLLHLPELDPKLSDDGGNLIYRIWYAH